MRPSNRIPLTAAADRALRQLASATASPAVSALDAETLLCERATIRGMRIPGHTSAGGRCTLFDAIGDTVALSLPRTTDLELLPALLEADELDIGDFAALRERIAALPATTLVSRGRALGLAIASEHETLPPPVSGVATRFDGACVELQAGRATPVPARTAPRIVDLSALWAGPLAAHLLWLAGAEVTKIESRSRPDAMRDVDATFYALLNQGKASVALNLADEVDRRGLLALIEQADIVIEAARPRALAQLGIDAAPVVGRTPGLVWITITGHGADGDAAQWIGFGDDCGVAGGLSAALRRATGRAGFVGDAIADPLTGIFAALLAWDAWKARRGGRYGLAMSRIVAHCLNYERRECPEAITALLQQWSGAIGTPFPSVARRPIGRAAPLGEHTHSCLSRLWR